MAGSTAALDQARAAAMALSLVDCEEGIELEAMHWMHHATHQEIVQ